MISIVTLDGTVHTILREAAIESKVIRNTLDAAEAGTDETIPVAVTDADWHHLAAFLTMLHSHAEVAPIVRIERPLKKKAPKTVIDIRDSGIPQWALEFIDSIPMGPKLLDVLEAAQALQIQRYGARSLFSLARV
jgi:hypothetical protein